MKKQISAAAAALTCLTVSVGVCAYSFYPLGRASAGEEAAQALLELNEQISAYEGSYTPEADRKAAEAEAEKQAEATRESTAETTAATQDEASSQDAATAEDAPAESTPAESAPAEDVPPAEVAPPEEEKPDVAALCGERLALSQEYYDELYAQGGEIRLALIDYDVMLRNLAVLREKCEQSYSKLEKLDELYRFGGAEQSDVQAAQAEYDGLFIDLRGALYEVGAKKAEIEAMTGEGLGGDFDYNSMYFITDALSIDPQALTDMTNLSAMITFTEQEEPEPEDLTAPYNDAVSAYYALGSAMRDYAAASLGLKKAEENARLALGTDEELSAARDEKNTAYLAAVQAKADYAKALLALDSAVSGALTGNPGADAAISGALSAVTASAEKGEGMWKCVISGGRKYYVPIVLPAKIARKNSGYDSCYITYGGKVVASGGAWQALAVDCGEFIDANARAQITFTKNGKQPVVYEISVLAPFGGFTAAA